MIEYVVWCLLGTLYGVIIGIMPMAGVTTGLLTVFGLADQFLANPYLGVVFMTSLIAACSTADSFTSILTGIPGSNTTAASIIDGYPMAKQGEAGRAIGIALMDSTVNGLFWGAIAFGLMPFYSKLIMFFGIPEFMAFMILSLACVGFITTRNPWLSIVSIAIGIFIGMIGQNPATGAYRLTFGWEYLAAGVQMIPLIAGLFAVPEVLQGFRQQNNRPEPIQDYWAQLRQGFGDCWRCRGDVARGGAIGFFTGLLPGVGGTIGDIMAYGATVARHKTEKFGVGNPRGLLGCEGANNAQKPASLIPTVLFGIPGAPFAAIMMAICMYFGLELGSPALLEDQDFITALGVAFIVGTILCFILCIFTTRWIVKILEIPYWIYAVVIMAIVTWSCVQYSGTWNDLYILAICSVLGVICVRFKISRPAVLVAYILSEKLENYSQQALTLYSFSDLIQRPLFSTLLFVSVLVISWSLLRRNRGIDFH
jgi:putative tricarboxylic transport membrane protein